jgi:hypothetical protein
MPGYGGGHYGLGAYGIGEVLPPNQVALAVHELKVSWDKAVGLTGWFTLGTSLLGGPDVLAPASQLVPTFVGDYDDLSPFLSEASWAFGRSSTFDEVQQGTWTGTIRDPDGRFNPNNPASPLYGFSDQPERPIRHRAYFDGVWYPQFFGYIRSVEYEPTSRGRGLLHIEADDLFGRLDVPAPTIAQLTGTTTGGVIGACLDSIGWTDPLYRSLDVGDAIDFWPGISDASSTLLALIEEVVQIEFGLFWADPAGAARYESRHAREAKPVAYSISGEMKAIAPGASRDRIINRATFTKEGSIPQIVTDATSADPVFGFGLRPGPEITSPYLRNDDAALQRASWVVFRRKDPHGDVYTLKTDNRTPELLQAVLDLGFSDRVQTSEAVTNSPFDGFIERVERSVTATPYRETANYMLSERTAVDLFTLGSSLLGGSHVLAL